MRRSFLKSLVKSNLHRDLKLLSNRTVLRKGNKLWPIFPNVPFLGPKKVRKSLVLWRFQGVQRWNIGLKWVKDKLSCISLNVIQKYIIYSTLGNWEKLRITATIYSDVFLKSYWSAWSNWSLKPLCSLCYEKFHQTLVFQVSHQLVRIFSSSKKPGSGKLFIYC